MGHPVKHHLEACGGGGRLQNSGPEPEYSEGWKGQGSGEDVRFRPESAEGLKRVPHVCEVLLSGSHPGMQARPKVA